MKWIPFFLLTVFLYISPTYTQSKPDYDMGKTQMVFLTRSPEWKQTQASEIRQQHRTFVSEMLQKGECALAGEITDDGDLREVLVFKNDSLELIQETVKRLPAVQSGMYKPEVLSWYVARNLIKSPNRSDVKEEYFFGILIRGEKWTPEVTDETKKIQEGHMANINRLAEMGKLVLAGPFYAGDHRRGIFIFKTSALEEARELTDTDPAVIAGRLKIGLHPMLVQKGILP